MFTMGHGWRLRFCALASLLGLYLVVSALLSTRRLPFPPTYDGSNNDNSKSNSNNNGLDSNNHGLPDPDQQFSKILSPMALKLQMQPRNLAAAVALSRRLTPRGMRSGPRIDWCRPPLGYKAAPGPVVALASFPGSGNTWLRYLLQQATGILTGSVYKDYALLKNGFPAESVVNGSVLAVKTHEFGPDARKVFDRVILLVRDPFASLQAEFNRRSGGHVGHASVDKYKRNGGKYWKNFVSNKASEWQRMNLDWYNSFSESDRLVVFYDRLYAAPMEELQTVLDFLRVSVSNSTLQCVGERKEGIYKRSKKKISFDVFDENMKSLLTETQKSVYAKLHRTDWHNVQVTTTNRNQVVVVDKEGHS